MKSLDKKDFSGGDLTFFVGSASPFATITSTWGTMDGAHILGMNANPFLWQGLLGGTALSAVFLFMLGAGMMKPLTNFIEKRFLQSSEPESKLKECLRVGLLLSAMMTAFSVAAQLVGLGIMMLWGMSATSVGATIATSLIGTIELTLSSVALGVLWNMLRGKNHTESSTYTCHHDAADQGHVLGRAATSTV